jgi:hypothetical protein
MPSVPSGPGGIRASRLRDMPMSPPRDRMSGNLDEARSGSVGDAAPAGQFVMT